MADQFMGGILAGSQSVTIPVILRVKSDGAELTGKVATAVSVYYWRQGATAIQEITCATLGSLGAAFSAGGWYEVDGTNFKGMYRLDLPNTAVSTGAEWVTIGVKDTAATGFYFYERFALDTKHVASLQDLSYADVKSAASAAWSAAAGTVRVYPADGALTAAVFGADCITSAKVAAGALVYDDQITTFKSELSGLVIAIPNGHITSAKIGADAIGSDKIAPGALVYDDQITTFKSELSGMAITIPNGHITSAKIGADAIGSDKVAPGAFTYDDQITTFKSELSGVYTRLTTVGVRDITQYQSAMAGAFPGSSPALIDALYWNYANAGFKRIQTPTSYVVYDAAGSTKLASAPISGTSGVEVVIGAFT